MSLKTWRYDLHVFCDRPSVRKFLKILLFPVGVYYMFFRRKGAVDSVSPLETSTGEPDASKFGRGILVTSYSSNNQTVMELSMLNHERYCTRFNLSMLCVNEPYTPFCNCDLLVSLLDHYDFVVCVGADVLFTDFEKDIRDFIVGPVVVQDEGTGCVNGDFIIFRDADALLRMKDVLEKTGGYSTSQEAMSTICSDDLKVLPVHTLQAPARYGNEGRAEVEHLLWRDGDFSMHFHQPLRPDTVRIKEEQMRAFFRDHPKSVR